MSTSRTLMLVTALALTPAATALAQGYPGQPSLPQAPPPPAPAAAAPAAPSAPVVVPLPTIAGHKCDRPGFPGKSAPDNVLRKWSTDFRGYVDCLKGYIAERNATIEANSKAAKTAVEEFNTNVSEFNEQVKALNQ